MIYNYMLAVVRSTPQPGMFHHSSVSAAHLGSLALRVGCTSPVHTIGRCRLLESIEVEAAHGRAQN